MTIQAERVGFQSQQAPVAEVPPSVAVQAQPALNICLLGYRSHPYGGGQGIYIKYLSKALTDAGHRVDVISGEPYPHLDPRVRLIKLPGMNLYEKGLASIRPRNLASWADCREWLGKLTGNFSEPLSFGMRVNAYLRRYGHRYDLIHDNQCLAYGMLRVQERQPLVTTIHHPITSDLVIALNAARSWWQRLLIRRWYHFLNMQKAVAGSLRNVVTVSEQSRQDIALAFGCPAERIALVYNGIDTSVFAPRPEIARRPARIMATASADAPLKGVRYLLEAYAELLVTHPGLELLIVGRPQPGGATDRRLGELGLRDRVSFVSGISTERLVELYAEATLVVVPSIYEGFGLPAGEAMACAVPVVSTTGGALPEVVGDAGLLVPTANPAALANAIARLLHDEPLRIELAARGRARIVERFSWEVCARQMTHYYREVLQDYANR